MIDLDEIEQAEYDVCYSTVKAMAAELRALRERVKELEKNNDAYREFAASVMKEAGED